MTIIIGLAPRGCRVATGKTKSGTEVVCEFFGIQITTKNPSVARVLTSDLKEVLSREVRLIPPNTPEARESADQLPEEKEAFEPDKKQAG